MGRVRSGRPRRGGACRSILPAPLRPPEVNRLLHAFRTPSLRFPFDLPALSPPRPPVIRGEPVISARLF